MQCPFCQSENREDRERCYVCERDISMLRLIINKSRHHYNLGLEHAERGRLEEAIVEMRNALDLDSRFIPAHVVLGTLLARQNQFDDARRAWEEALQVVPELGKAHTYLGRIQTVQECLPAVRRMRLITIIAVLASLVLLVFMLFSQRESKSVERLRQAQVAYDAGHYGRALKLLDGVRKSAPGESIQALAAKAFLAALKADMQQQLRTIRDLKFQQEFPLALTKIAELEQREPDTETSASLAEIRNDINHYYRSRIDGTFENYLDGSAPYEELAQQILQFIEVYPDIPEKEELRRYLSRAQDEEVQREVEATRADFDTDHEISKALGRLRELQARFPGSGAVETGRAALIDEMLTWMFDHFQVLIDENDYEGAGSHLESIAELAGEFRDVVDVAGPLELAWQVLSDAQKSGEIKLTEELVRSGDPTEARLAIFDLWDNDNLTSAERDLLVTYLDELEVREFEEDIESVKELDSKYRALTITDEQASITLERAPDLIDSVFATGDEREALLAYSALSALKLGDRERAQEFLDSLKQENNGSIYVTDVENALKKKKK